MVFQLSPKREALSDEDFRASFIRLAADRYFALNLNILTRQPNQNPGERKEV